MAYEVVEKDPTSGRFETRRIEKPGPTGLITTSTKSLGIQMSTCVLEVPVADDADQTRKVMHAHARSVMPGTMAVADRRPFLALQSYLAAIGPDDVGGLEPSRPQIYKNFQ